MLAWFVIVAPIVVAEVFRSPMVDYRFVALGAALPLLEVLSGSPPILHTLLAPVAGLAVVMAATRNRRLVRRRVLGIPIGLFLHLVLDGTWTDAEMFWWPALGADLAGHPVPELGWSLAFIVTLELAALALAAVAWRRYQLGTDQNWRKLLRDGHLPRSVFR
jgi:hypothetical protein